MKIVCAWCNAVIGGRGSRLSHGICKRCFADMFQSQFGFMQSLPRLPRSSRLARRPSLNRAVQSVGIEQIAFGGFN